MTTSYPMIKPNQRQHFDCDCGWEAHGLVLETDDDGFLSVYVRTSRYDLSLWNRVKAAWATLRGQEHVLSEIILDRSQVERFVTHVCSLMHNEDTG